MANAEPEHRSCDCYLCCSRQVIARDLGRQHGFAEGVWAAIDSVTRSFGTPIAEVVDRLTLLLPPSKSKQSTTFTKELEHLINRYSMENGSDTPDFILAEFLRSSLEVFNKTVRERERWYGRGGQLTEPTLPPPPDAVVVTKGTP